MADDTTPQDTTPPADQAPDDGANPPNDDNLGDPGKRALDAERAARKEAEKQARAVQKELEQLRQAQMSESEKALAEAEARGKLAQAKLNATDDIDVMVIDEFQKQNRLLDAPDLRRRRQRGRATAAR
jgi:hypothetical protein